MKPAPRLPHPLTSVWSPAAASLGALLMLSGCASDGAKKTDPASAVYLAPLNVEVGRVISYDAKAGTALVAVSPFAKIPAKLAGQSLIARHPATLVETARMVVSAHHTGSVFGAYVLEGAPSPDDEIVIPPAPSESAAPSGAPAAAPSDAPAPTPAAPAP